MRTAAIVGLMLVPVLAIAVMLWWTSRPPAPAFVFAAPSASGAARAGTPARLMAAGSSNHASARALAPDVEMVGAPQPSFDGQRILFAGRKLGEKAAQIWQVRRDGGGLTQITHEAADCSEPHYLPNDQLVYARSEGGTNALYVFTLDGKAPTRISFNADPIRDTVVLLDGRIVGRMGRALVTVNTDGTGIAAYTGTPEELAAIRADQAKALSPTRARPVPTGHVSVVDRQKRATGLLVCLNAYLSDQPGVQSLPDGTIKTVRVWVDPGHPRLLGQAPVERDGSFLLEVPSDTSFRVETLDARGKAVGGTCAWVWVRPNESRACIGCHESHDLVPENHVQMALGKKPVSLVAKRTAPAAPAPKESR